MNRLWVRLTLAFVAVTLIAVGSVAAFAVWSASNQFGQFVVRQDTLGQTELMNNLGAYYQLHGNWEGVGALFGGPLVERGRGPGAAARGRPSLLLADGRGRIVYDDHGGRLGRQLMPAERENAVPITVGSSTAGYLVPQAPPAGVTFTVPEQAFLDQIRGTFVLAALAAGSISVVIGLLISRTVAAPLARLAAAARAFAGRDWTQRVKVGGADEIADVGRAFNDMADSLERADTQRRHLMADVAHELRTPLTVVQGNLRALLDGVYPLETREIATLYDQTRLLSRLVDDLREMALAESGQMPLNLQSTDAARVARDVAATYAAAADAQQVVMTVNTPQTLPSVRADADRLAQVLQNLVTNALRHTLPGGSITVEIAAPAEQPDGWVRIVVHDTGEGIAAEDLPHVFERFYRGDPSRARSSGGSGLGLSIARTLVEAMGGRIGAESVRGQGSTFWFTLHRAAEG
jgi:two-component system OmpR family sensor kinase/two-component system sensor histidine kinase BaeS